MKVKWLFTVTMSVLFCLGYTQEVLSLPVLSSETYRVAPLAASGLDASGAVYIADYGLGNTSLVVLSLNGAAGKMRPAHLHRGNCGSGGGIVVPLEPVNPETGLSVTVTTASFTDMTTNDYYLNVHASSDDLGTLIACGEVGANAKGVMSSEGSAAETTTSSSQSATMPAGSKTKTGVKAEEFETQIPTAAYGIFAVGGSGISGQVQVSGQVEGGTRIALSLTGAEARKTYPTELRSGDCGPDGTLLRQLNDFPLGVVDPGASETTTTLSFEEIVEANNYLTIYAADGSGTVIACGEVGLGANR